MKLSTVRPHARVTSIAVASVVAAGATACGTATPSATAPPSTSAAASPSPSRTGSASPSAAPKAASKAAPVPVEQNPPGDIPDNLAFVKYANKPGRYSFTHPEGWAQTGHGAQVRFTDKLNGVTVDSVSASQAPTPATARSSQIPALKTSVPAFELRGVTAVTLPGGKGVRIVFRRNSAPDEVTGKVFRDEVEEYAVYSNGRLVRMDLYGPVGADNVDAYRTMSQSLVLR